MTQPEKTTATEWIWKVVVVALVAAVVWLSGAIQNGPFADEDGPLKLSDERRITGGGALDFGKLEGRPADEVVERYQLAAVNRRGGVEISDRGRSARLGRGRVDRPKSWRRPSSLGLSGSLRPLTSHR